MCEEERCGGVALGAGAGPPGPLTLSRCPLSVHRALQEAGTLLANTRS